MNITQLALNNFRNIRKMEIEPCPGMNVICGENAQGKTNLLEAIWLFTGAKSFRGSRDKDFVRFGEEKAEWRATFYTGGVEKSITLETEEKRRAFLNDKPVKTAAALAGNLNAIIFSPGDLRIVSDGPAVRRRFLDLSIGQLYPAYIDILRSYLRGLEQRNRLIKDYRYEPSVGTVLDSFEREIAQNGEKILTYRTRYMELLSRYLPEIYSGISEGKEELTLRYIKSFDGENLAEKLAQVRKEDMYTGKTSIGPHRDDLGFYINGSDARNFGSQGQKRSVALSLKLAEAEVIKKNVGECPLCLLDDVMSELDPKRQNYILNRIKEMQTFLTCCDPENVKSLIAGKIFTIKDGAVI